MCSIWVTFPFCQNVCLFVSCKGMTWLLNTVLVKVLGKDMKLKTWVHFKTTKYLSNMLKGARLNVKNEFWNQTYLRCMYKWRGICSLVPNLTSLTTWITRIYLTSFPTYCLPPLPFPLPLPILGPATDWLCVFHLMLVTSATDFFWFW